MAQIWSEKGILIFVLFFLFYVHFDFSILSHKHTEHNQKTENVNKQRQDQKSSEVIKGCERIKMYRSDVYALADGGHKTPHPPQSNTLHSMQLLSYHICYKVGYFYIGMSKYLKFKKLFEFKKSIKIKVMQCNSPSSADFSAELNCESYFNAVSYGIFSTSRCRPCTN